MNWIGDTGPYKYGTAVTAFFIGEDLTDDVQDSLSLIRNLERYLQPYVREEDNATADPDVFFDPGKGCADCSACFALYPAEDASMNREDFNAWAERAASQVGQHHLVAGGRQES